LPRAASIALAGLALTAAQSAAVILPAVPIDGPSPEIVGFGGVAMAADGTGGLVYLKRVDGVAHVFVARYLDGHWLAPTRVDYAQHYAASWPCIGAADNGELLVAWATPYASENEQPVYRLMSAVLAPGASSFGAAQIVDRNIGLAQGTSPDLAMSSTGQADVVYRVLKGSTGERTGIPLLHPGDVVEEVRVAHFRGEQWYPLGEINHDAGVSMRPPTQADAPQIAVGPTGAGVVVWQEPDTSGVARIWARRLFGASVGYSMEASATSYAGQPLNTEADAPSVALSRLGQAEVAYRQGGGAGSPLPGPRIFVNTLPDGESVSGAKFQGAALAGPPPVGGEAAPPVGRPSIDIDEKRLARLVYDSGGTPLVVEGSDKGHLGPGLTLGPAFVGSALTPASELPCASVLDPEGGGIAAWPSADEHGNTGVAIREDFPDGAVQTALVSGQAGGPIAQLAVGRSGLGDGLVAFEQGPIGDAAILAAPVSAPPANFLVSVPRGWVTRGSARVSWQPSASANEPVLYTVILDGHRLATPSGALALSIPAHDLGNGVHWVQVLASDADGQAVLTPTLELKIGNPPTHHRRSRRRGGRRAEKTR
jgi:hypothetical protein